MNHGAYDRKAFSVGVNKEAKVKKSKNFVNTVKSLQNPEHIIKMESSERGKLVQ